MEHVVFLDRSGYGRYRHPDGRPFLDPSRYEVTLLTLPEKASAAPSHEVARVIPTNVLDPQAIMDVVPQLRAGPTVHWVVAIGERFLVPAARLREALAVPGFSVDQMRVFRDKAAMKRHFRAHGIRTPEFREIERPADAAQLLEKYGRIILKPLLSMGSVGVHRISSQSELDALDATGLGHEGPYEAEEFVDGQIYHVDSVVEAGRPVAAMASRYLDANSVFPTGGQCRSVEVDGGPERDVVLTFNEQMLAAVGWFTGVTHLEVFLDRSNTAVLCEIAGRPGGGGIIPAFRHRFGIDLDLATILPQLGRALPTRRESPPDERRATGWSVIYPPELGRVRSFDAVPDIEWIVQFRQIKKPGDVLVPAASFGQGVAVATVCGPDAASVTNRLDRVKSSLSLAVEPASIHEGIR